MKTKEIKITPPEGFEIDKENSTFECIKFKPIKKGRWKDDENSILTGYCITFGSTISKVNIDSRLRNIKGNFNIFATEKQAKSALAMARISQIMANDVRFGGVITDEEWENGEKKYVLQRYNNKIQYNYYYDTYYFLAFHTAEQRDLFLEENEDLIKDYLML